MSLKAIIADSNSRWRMDLKRVIRSVNRYVQITEVESIDDMVTWALKGEYSLIFTEYKTPFSALNGIDGIIKVKAEHPELPIYLISFGISDEIKEAAKKAGVHGYFSKYPLDETKLKKSIRPYLT